MFPSAAKVVSNFMVDAGFIARSAFRLMRGANSCVSCTTTATLDNGICACLSAALTGSGKVVANTGPESRLKKKQFDEKISHYT